MKFRYFIQLSYKGTNYFGWQVQPNHISVQEVLNQRLSTLLSEEIQVVGAGRTDTGVHATYFIAHFDTTKSGLDNDDKFLYKLNRFLPHDIAIQKIIQVKETAHSRFDATSRSYEYHINTKKSPFSIEDSYYYHGELNIKKMNEAAKLLFNYTDFTSFSKLHTDVKTNNCKIYQTEWEAKGEKLIFTIKADRFLRNMVRAIVGTLLEVGKDKMIINEFIKIIENKDRCKAGSSAPAHGLFLTDIEYPENIYLK